MLIRKSILAIACAATVAGALVTATVPAVAVPSVPGSVSGDDNVAYIPSDYPFGADNAVRAVNLTTGEIERTYEVGPGPLVVKETLDHTKLYVSSIGVGLTKPNPGLKFESAVSVIDKASGAVTKIPTLGPPFAVLQLSNDGRFLYVPTAASVVQVIDTATDAIVRTMALSHPSQVYHIEISPDGATLFAMSGDGAIVKYDAVTGRILGVPLYSEGIAGWGAQSSDGKRLYSVNIVGDVVSIDVAAWKITHAFDTPEVAVSVSATLSPDETELWICNYSGNAVEIFDVDSGVLKSTIPTVGSPSYVGFSGDATKAYVTIADYGIGRGPANLPAAGYLETYDVASQTQLNRFPLGRVGPAAGVFPE